MSQINFDNISTRKMYEIKRGIHIALSKTNNRKRYVLRKRYDEVNKALAKRGELSPSLDKYTIKN